MSGITDVLFNAVADGGVVTTEPMVALSYELDPSLESGIFTLRQGVQFHGGYGEMTAKDVEFSYNDANSVTNPESIHGQAGDFAPLISSMEAVDDYTLKLNYRNYDSRGILHRFSSFWQTAGIMSTAVFAEHGVEGMQDIYVGVGPFENSEWSQNGKIEGTAFADYYGTVGPEKMTLLEVPEGASRRAMLETGEVAISQVATKDYPGLSDKGFNAQKGGMFNTIRDVSMVGNYWETHNALTGAELTRDRDTSLPWIGNPFENGDYDETTPSMVSSQKVREAFAFAIDREALVENLLGGLGFVNHQPYLAGSNPNYQADWDFGLDYDAAKALMADAGQSGGFEMDLWVGTGELGAEIGESVGAAWQENLGVKVNLIKTAYSTYRPGLVARTNKTPGVNICGDENKSNFPYDWAHGFVKSSFSAGGYGVGQEIPYATKSYSLMSGEPDKAVREELAAEFYTNNRKWVNCIGFFEEPLWPYWDPKQIESWDMRPQANGNIGTINNVNLVIMK
jgi:ABC-type transport system substrate-binding protein